MSMGPLYPSVRAAVLETQITGWHCDSSSNTTVTFAADRRRWDNTTSYFELYDLNRDPSETRNLIDRDIDLG